MVKRDAGQLDGNNVKPVETIDWMATLPAELLRFRVLSTRQAAQLLGVSEATLERLRKLKTGPKYLILSPRRIGYRVIDLIQGADERASGGNDAA